MNTAQIELLRTDPLDIALRLNYLAHSSGDDQDKEARRKEKKKLKEEKVSDVSRICTYIPLP